MNAHINMAALTKLSNSLVKCTRCSLHTYGVMQPHIGKDVRGLVITDEEWNWTMDELKELIILRPANCKGEASPEHIEACRIINQFYIDNGGVMRILGLGEAAKAWFSTPADGEYDYGKWVLFLASSMSSPEVVKFREAIAYDFIPF
jgi:hypothetical protein